MRQLQLVDVLDLVAAYKEAEYAVVLDGDALRLHVGKRADDLEAYWPAKRYGFITAWNPASRPNSDAANDAANAELARQLEAAGIARHQAHAYAPSGSWGEAGWLVVDVEDTLLDLLGRQFGQAGVLSWAFGQPARLRMLLPRPPNAGSDPHVDWAPLQPSNRRELGAMA